MSLKKRVAKCCAVGVAASLVTAGCGVTNSQDGSGGGSGGDGPFYEGQTITMIVPFDAGGASDVFSRTLAGYLSDHIDGSPEIVIENVPGGAQKDGLNRFERMDHDNGLYLAMGSGGLVASTQFDQEGIQFDLNEYETLVAFGGSMIVFGSVAAGIESLEDLAESEEATYYAAMEMGASEVARTHALDEMGLPGFHPLMGYDGGGAVTAAVLRGEATIGYSTTSHYMENVVPLEEDGDITPLMTQGYVVDGEIVRDPAFPDLPTMYEAYEILTGDTPDGMGWDVHVTLTAANSMLRNYWIHSDAPDEAKEALRDAISQVVEDEDFLQDSLEVLGEESPAFVDEEAEQAVRTVQELTPESVAWVEDYIDEVNSR